MSGNTTVAPIGDPGSPVRSLPPKPSLEFERKRAKALLRRLRRSEPNAKLADAQFLSARELGFTSWPRLVQYFRTLEREVSSARRGEGYRLEHYDARVGSLLAEHRLKREWTGRALAAFVPRLYGRSIAEVLVLPVTTDDARAVVARQHGYASWEHLLDAEAAERARRVDPWSRQSSPRSRAAQAINMGDLTALERIVDECPELLRPSEDDERRGHTLVSSALFNERRTQTPEARRVTDWLASRGMELTGPINEMLLGFHDMTAAQVQDLLNRGADPHWVPANGFSVLEHAIIRNWNGDSVDVLARHSVPRRALWTAAGLGDVAGVQRYFDRSGKLITAAYRDRPPFYLGALPGSTFPSLPDPDEHEILAETALVAVLNGRTAVIELLIEHGFPIDYLGFGGTSLLRFAIGQRTVSMVKALLRLGADLDKKGQWPEQTPREFAKEVVRYYPGSPELRTILELCGAGTPEEALAEMDRQRPSPPPFAPKCREMFELAGDDAARRGQTEIRDENLFIALLRWPPLMVGMLSRVGVDIARLHGEVADRLLPVTDRVERQPLPFDDAANVIIERAVALADSRRHEEVHLLRVFEALVARDGEFTTNLIVACGGSLSRLREQLSRA